MSQDSIIGSGGGGSGSELKFHTGSGDATSVLRVIDFVGAGGTTLSASGQTVTVTSTAAPFVPNQVIQDFDDFLSKTNNQLGKLTWQDQGWDQAGGGTATNPGQITCSQQSAYAVALYLTVNDADGSRPGPFVLGSGSLNINWVFDLATLSTAENHYTAYFGLGDSTTIFMLSVPGFTDGVYFQYTNDVNSGNWQIVTTSSSVSTIVNTSIPASIGFHNYGIQINATGTSCTYTIDGVSAGSAITTHIPTDQITPAVELFADVGMNPISAVDLFYYTQTLTVPR